MTVLASSCGVVGFILPVTDLFVLVAVRGSRSDLLQHHSSNMFILTDTRRVQVLTMFVSVSHSGVDLVALINKLHMLPEDFNTLVAGTSTFVISYAVHKLFSPVRTGITLASAPLFLLSFPSHNFFPLAGACLSPLCHCGQVVSRAGLV